MDDCKRVFKKYNIRNYDDLKKFIYKYDPLNNRDLLLNLEDDEKKDIIQILECFTNNTNLIFNNSNNNNQVKMDESKTKTKGKSRSLKVSKTKNKSKYLSKSKSYSKRISKKNVKDLLNKTVVKNNNNPVLKQLENPTKNNTIFNTNPESYSMYTSQVDTTTLEPSTLEPSTLEPPTLEPSTLEPSTLEPSTLEPSTLEPSTLDPTKNQNDDTFKTQQSPDYQKLKNRKINYPNIEKVKFSKKKYDCIRQRLNFANIARNMKYDHRRYLDDPKKLNRKMKEILRPPLEKGASPKLMALLNKIKELDEDDMKKYGKNFKHFIYSDVKQRGYGAKIIAAGMVAYDYTPSAYYTQTGRVDILPIDRIINNGKMFGLLSSTSMYGKPFSQKLKNKIIERFNERPNNINGKNMRFIIADSGFKEGIDLFDVKYVHLFEPSISMADMKQAVGRATRFCGSKGLRFIPGKGVDLNVYTYDIDFSIIYPNIKYKNAFQLLLAHSNIDISVMNSNQIISNIVMNSAIDYELNYPINSLSIKSLKDAEEKQKEILNNNNDENLGQGRNTNIEIIKSKMSSLSLNDMKLAYLSILNKIPRNISNKNRDFYMNELEKNPKYLKSIERLQNDYVQSLIKYSDKLEMFGKGNRNITMKRKNNRVRNSISSTRKNNINELDQSTSNIVEDLVKSSRTKANKTLNKRRIMNMITFDKFESIQESRKYIRKYYSMFKWSKPEIKNLCGRIENNNDNDIITKQSKILNKSKKVGNNRKYVILNYSPSQNFIRHYFTPLSPYKGVLLWHSVGTGKTCASIATASTSFERLDYNIIFVTRTTLKNELWKNMFTMVCDRHIKNKILQTGEIPSDDLNHNIRKFLSNQWFRPMSYKQFSNTLAGKNEYYTRLLNKNGNKDILRKTLVIFDEAHQLYSDGLSGQEKPDIEIIEKMIQKSYNISKNNSVRLMFLTATPINTNFMELIKLYNLMLENNKFPNTIEEFSNKYLEEDGQFKNKQLEYEFSNRISPYTSYLTRESDPRQFPIPKYHNVIVPLEDVDNDNKYNEIETMKLSLSRMKENLLRQEIQLKKQNKKMELLNEARKKYKKQEHQKKIRRYYSRTKEIIKELRDTIRNLKFNIKKLSEKLRLYKRKYKNDMENKIKNNIPFALQEKCGVSLGNSRMEEDKLNKTTDPVNVTPTPKDKKEPEKTRRKVKTPKERTPEDISFDKLTPKQVMIKKLALEQDKIILDRQIININKIRLEENVVEKYVKGNNTYRDYLADKLSKYKQDLFMINDEYDYIIEKME
jgi:hypothetical protein